MVSKKNKQLLFTNSLTSKKIKLQRKRVTNVSNNDNDFQDVDEFKQNVDSLINFLKPIENIEIENQYKINIQNIEKHPESNSIKNMILNHNLENQDSLLFNIEILTHITRDFNLKNLFNLAQICKGMHVLITHNTFFSYYLKKSSYTELWQLCDLPRLNDYSIYRNLIMYMSFKKHYYPPTFANYKPGYYKNYKNPNKETNTNWEPLRKCNHFCCCCLLNDDDVVYDDLKDNDELALDCVDSLSDNDYTEEEMNFEYEKFMNEDYENYENYEDHKNDD